MARISSIMSKRKNWVIPVVTLGLTLLSYALFSPSLGFYLDDWPQLYSLLIRGTEGIKSYYLYDGRPFGYWPDLLFFKLWGTNALAWHLTNYLLRWLTAMLFYWSFQRIWPSQRRELGWFAILFAVYPIFTQQSMGIMFIAHWMCYLCFALSILLMVAGIQSQKWKVPLFMAAVLVNAPNLFTHEYFIGVEFIRPLIIWFSLPSHKNYGSKVIKTIFHWLPFLALAAFFVYWRLFMFENLRASNSPVLLSALYHQPGETLLILLNYIFKDFTQVVLGVWYTTFNPDTFDFRKWINALALLLSLAVFVFSFVLVKKTRKNEMALSDETLDKYFDSKLLVLGICGILLGCAPGWLIMRSVSDSYGLWNDRFALPAILGACLFLVGLFGVLTGQNRKLRETMFIVLIALAVGRNFYITHQYKTAAQEQNQFFNQLKWRAPYIQSRTPIYSDNEYFSYMGVYPTAFALNLTYPMVELMPRTDYWFYQLHKFSPSEITNLIHGQKIDAVKWYIYFEAESNNGLIVNWSEKTDHCVWILSQNDRYNPLISANTKNALALSNLDRIDPTAEISVDTSSLFGPEDRDTWCYYYEKGDLARQTSDWQTAVNQYEEAEANGYSPDNGVELMPFIEAYAQTGNLQKSLQLTRDALELTDNIAPYLCDNWNRFTITAGASESLKQAYEDFSTEYGCKTFLAQ